MTVVTFDLPIWVKAVDIIESQLPIVPRSGGFHLLKSFLGTLGSIFADSGLYDLIQLIYPGQVAADSILNGNSFDKAIRSHILIAAAIVQHTLPPESFTESDFSLHLSCISARMISIFAAAGHHYAKAARLYVKLMILYEGSESKASIIKSFKTNASHVVRYSPYEWSGIWSDLSIEQTLMRTDKTNGGLSGGRFRKGESAHRIWVQTLSHLPLLNRLSSEPKEDTTH